MSHRIERWLDRLKIDNPRNVEIEVKRRVEPGDLKKLRADLMRRKRVRHRKAAFFFDQFLDTPKMDVFRRGASLRIRYKGNGSRVYIQYKGPGFMARNLLVRSEFSSGALEDIVLEESHHDIVHFSEETIQHLLRERLPVEMRRAMRRHLGARTLGRISQGPILSFYRKDKFVVEEGDAVLEPSLDQIFAFHISRTGLHPVSSFCEYELEVKAEDLETKLDTLERLRELDRKLTRRFRLPLERLDKYHRSASFFFPSVRKKRRARR